MSSSGGILARLDEAGSPDEILIRPRLNFDHSAWASAVLNRQTFAKESKICAGTIRANHLHPNPESLLPYDDAPSPLRGGRSRPSGTVWRSQASGRRTAASSAEVIVQGGLAAPTHHGPSGARHAERCRTNKARFGTVQGASDRNFLPSWADRPLLQPLAYVTKKRANELT